LIYGNTDKDIETMIGKLVNEAENGTVEEEKKMFQEFPKEKDIHEMMEQMTPLDKFYE
jgi:ribosomal protein L17